MNPVTASAFYVFLEDDFLLTKKKECHENITPVLVEALMVFYMIQLYTSAKY